MSIKYLTYTIHTTPDFKESTVEKLSLLYAEMYMIYDELVFRMAPYNPSGANILKVSGSGGMMKLLHEAGDDFFKVINENFAVFEEKRDFISAYEAGSDYANKTGDEQSRYKSEVSQVVNGYVKCFNYLKSTYDLFEKAGYTDANIKKFYYLKTEQRSVYVEDFIFHTEKLLEEWAKELNLDIMILNI